jgi:hypothetical protein
MNNKDKVIMERLNLKNKQIINLIHQKLAIKVNQIIKVPKFLITCRP